MPMADLRQLRAIGRMSTSGHIAEPHVDSAILAAILLVYIALRCSED
jgi:hypothetical protein